MITLFEVYEPSSLVYMKVVCVGFLVILCVIFFGSKLKNRFSANKIFFLKIVSIAFILFIVIVNVCIWWLHSYYYSKYIQGYYLVYEGNVAYEKKRSNRTWIDISGKKVIMAGIAPHCLTKKRADQLGVFKDSSSFYRISFTSMSDPISDKFACIIKLEKMELHGTGTAKNNR